MILTAWEPETASRDLDEAIEEARRAGARIIAPGDSGLPLSDDDAFLALRPRLRHGFIAGPSARAAILAGLTARGE